MISRDTAALVVVVGYLVALAILLISVPMSIVARWQDSSHRVSSGARRDVWLQSRWIGSNARALNLLTPGGQRRLRRATYWTRITVVGLAIIIGATLWHAAVLS